MYLNPVKTAPIFDFFEFLIQLNWFSILLLEVHSSSSPNNAMYSPFASLTPLFVEYATLELVLFLKYLILRDLNCDIICYCENFEQSSIIITSRFL